MKNTKALSLIAVGAVIIAGSLWFLKSPQEPTLSEEQATTTVESNVEETPGATTTKPTTPTTKAPTPTLPVAKKQETYTNGIYKFSLSFPNGYQTEQFSNFHDLNNVDWRVNATAAKRGMPIIALPVFRIDQGSISAGKKYPLFFTAEVRVGVSPDIAQCYAKDDGYTNQKVTNVTINGVQFKKFDFESAGMMKYVRGSSYRTIYANKCYVIEQIRHGTVYKDDTMLPGYNDVDLDAFYNKTTPVVYSFKFI
jgi:hypothetical protein